MPRGGARPGAGRKKREKPVDGALGLISVKPQGKPGVGRVAGGRFAPGCSGNPGGHPGAKGERAYLVARYGEDAHVLHEEMDKMLASAKAPWHVKADLLKFKLERHSGRAVQAVNVQIEHVPLFVVPGGVQPDVSGVLVSEPSHVEVT
jgi:hypothetical protein